MSRAVIYERISDDRGGTGLGVARQDQDCRALCAERGWTVAEVLVDNDRSAYSGKRRPAYERLLEGLQAGSWDVVVAWHPDRLHRSPKELERFIDVVEEAKAKVATVSAGTYDLSSATGRMAARIVGATARYASEQASERIQRKHRELAEGGHPVGGGTRPFGYLPDRVALDATEAALVRAAARDVLDGVPIRAVARAWTEAGVRTVTGTPWSSTVVRRILTSPRSAGLRVHGGKQYRGTWEPLLDELTWRRLKAVLLDPDRRVNQAPRTYLLTGGIAVCGICTAPLVARPRSDKRRSYVCASGPGFHGCGKIRVLASALEEDVRGQVAMTIDADPLPKVQGAGDVPRLLAQIDQAEAAEAELSTDYYVHRSVTRAQFQAATAALEAKLDALRSEVGRHEVARRTPLDADAVALLADDEPSLRQRAVVAGVVESVTVGPAVRGRNRYDPTRVQIAWR